MSKNLSSVGDKTATFHEGPGWDLGTVKSCAKLN